MIYKVRICLIELPLCAWRLRVVVRGSQKMEHPMKPLIALAIAAALFSAPAAAYGLARNFLAGNGAESI
jgi:hypothetical protein